MREKRKPRRSPDGRRKLPADPEATLQALIALNPEQGPEVNDEDLQKIVRGPQADPELDEPPER
jgi:hypothetical protein